MSIPVLEIKHMSSGYEGSKVIEDLSLHIHEGEILGIVGESGSGKSTLFHSILGIKRDLDIFSGEIRFYGENIPAPESQKREMLGKRIGAVFQHSAFSLVPNRKISKQFEEFGKRLKLSRKEVYEIALETFRIFCLENVERIYDAYPFELSGGMQQRVSIALAMLASPDLLLCDEPTSALDVRSAYEIVQEFLRLREKKRTAMLMITHNLSLAAKLCDRIAVMYKGKLVEEGNAKEILSHPREAYTKKLIEAIPVLGKVRRTYPQEGAKHEAMDEV